MCRGGVVFFRTRGARGLGGGIWKAGPHDGGSEVSGWWARVLSWVVVLGFLDVFVGVGRFQVFYEFYLDRCLSRGFFRMSAN